MFRSPDLIDQNDAHKESIAGKSISVRLSKNFPALGVRERIHLLRSEIPGRLVFTTSFGLEDQALTHLIAESGADIDFVTLDTGRLFPETYTVWAETEARYAIRIHSFSPDAEALRQLIGRQGINGFYTSPEARKACCGIRKLAPLEQALDGASAWITGLRADQSALRRQMKFVSRDEDRDVLKINPLLDWPRDRITALVDAENVPVNALHRQGFLSIGCAPCTRAIAPGEPERAGRWWWETEGASECGLHLAPDGRLVTVRKTP